MYTLNPQYAGMYDGTTTIKKVREHCKCVDVYSTNRADRSTNLKIKVVAMDGREVAMETTGKMRLADIIDFFSKAIRKGK